MIAVGQAAERLRKIQSAKSDIHRAWLHNSAIHDQCLIYEKRTCRHQKRIFVHACDDVHFSRHSGHQIVGRIFHL